MLIRNFEEGFICWGLKQNEMDIAKGQQRGWIFENAEVRYAVNDLVPKYTIARGGLSRDL